MWIADNIIVMWYSSDILVTCLWQGAVSAVEGAVILYALAKWLSHYFILLSFLFLFGLTIQGRSTEKYHMTMLQVTVICQNITRSCHIMVSHDKCRKVVYRLCSSCISSIQNQIGTLLSSPYQLGLGVWLSHLRLSHYTRTQFHI